MKYYYKDKILSSYCDSHAKLSMMGACYIAQDATTCTLKMFNMDNITLREKHGAMFVFLKNKVVFKNNIYWDDEYKIEAYVSKIDKIRVYIDIILYNNKDEVVMESRIESCILDIKTRRILRISSIGETIETEEPKFNLDFNELKDGDIVCINYRKVMYSSIDYSLHTNNVEYVRYIMDIYGDRLFKSFEIHYKHECKLNDNLKIIDYGNNFKIENEDGVLVVEAIVE